MMKILICNNRYFISGGPERYMFAVQALLELKGHKAIPFSINCSNNRETVYSRYFAKPLLDKDYIYYSDSPLTFVEKLKLFHKTIYNFEAGKKLREAIRKEHIDVVYVLQAVNFLYSSVINESWKMGVPVVVRFSDFQLLCPAYTFFRNGAVCEDCKHGYFRAVRNRCLQDSYGVSFARVIAMYAYKLLSIQEKIDIIIAPSKFLRDKLIEFGIDKSKVVNIPSYVDTSEYEPNYNSKPYVLYVGNIQKYKGVEVLIKAFKNIDRAIQLKIVGRSNDGEDKRLMGFVRDEGMGNVEFLGFKTGNGLKTLYQNSLFVVVPSVWYDNSPHVILESMAYGKPVIGSNHGSIPELIDDNVDGLYFEPANFEDLAQKIQYLIDNREILPEMGRKARQKVEERYNLILHYERLMKVYQQVLANRRN